MQDLLAADAHPWPVIAHEFLHALGVYHEQSRSDRDAFVEIKWDNIQDGPPPAGEINALGNFQTKPGSVDYFDYDYGSVMHYHATAFAKDTSKPTIVPRQAGAVIGQRNGLSFGDRQTVAKIYERFFPKGYSGVWRAGSGRYGLWANDDWNGFAAKWQAWSADGLRLVDIHVQPTRQGLRYSGVFSEGSGGHALWVDAPWDSFVAKWQEWSNQGLRLHDIHVVTVNGQDRWTGAFLQGSGGPRAVGRRDLGQLRRQVAGVVGSGAAAARRPRAQRRRPGPLHRRLPAGQRRPRAVGERDLGRASWPSGRSGRVRGCAWPTSTRTGRATRRGTRRRSCRATTATTCGPTSPGRASPRSGRSSAGWGCGSWTSRW